MKVKFPVFFVFKKTIYVDLYRIKSATYIKH